MLAYVKPVFDRFGQFKPGSARLVQVRSFYVM